jgi:hypothetical protein
MRALDRKPSVRPIGEPHIGQQDFARRGEGIAAPQSRQSSSKPGSAASLT